MTFHTISRPIQAGIPPIHTGSDEPVLTGPTRIHGKEITRSLVMKGIDGETQAILGSQSNIALHLSGNNLIRFGVVGSNSYVEKIFILQQPHFRFLRRGYSFHRHHLGKIRKHFRGGPNPIVQLPIDHWRFSCLNHAHRIGLRELSRLRPHFSTQTHRAQNHGQKNNRSRRMKKREHASNNQRIRKR